MKKDNIKPGQWHGEEFEIEVKDKKEEQVEPKLTYSDDLILMYSAFRDNVYNPRSVLYPSCGFDASPANVFQKVTFVDSEKKDSHGCIDKLKEAGYSALKQDIRNYFSQELHDLLILLNPAFPTVWATKYLSSGAYILANNYHGNASQMHERPKKFNLWGVIDFEKDKRKDKKVIISRNLENLFEKVANEEDLKKFRPDYYDFLKVAFKACALSYPEFDLNKPFEEVWGEFRKLMDEGFPYKRSPELYIFVKK